MAGKVRIEYDEKDIRELIKQDIESKMGISVDESEIQILVQSKQNYRVHEWESGKFKAAYENIKERVQRWQK